MSPPPPAERAATLAGLLDVPYDPATDPDVAMVALIAHARSNGITWAQIGSVTIGCRNPRAAKRHAHRLARAVNARIAPVLQEVLDA